VQQQTRNLEMVHATIRGWFTKTTLREAHSATLQIEGTQEQRESMSSLLPDGDQVWRAIA
jgi:hypothetical protein